MQHKLTLLFAFFCVSVFANAQSGSSSGSSSSSGSATPAASTNTRTVSEIMTKLNRMVDLAEAGGNEVVRTEVDLISTEKTTIRSLSEGWTYTIMAAGSSRIEDLDIVVYKLTDGEWIEVGKDADHSSVAAVVIKPTATGQYKVVVKAYKFKSGNTVGHYSLIIYHE